MPALSSRSSGRRLTPHGRSAPGSRLPAGRQWSRFACLAAVPAFRSRTRGRLGACFAILTCLLTWQMPVARAACEEPPPAVRDIIADRFYVDTASSIADKAIIARNRNALATLDRTLNAILNMADKGLAGDADSAVCAGRWLAAWAKGGAMLGKMSSRQAEVERKWRTAGMAVGYLKIRPMIDPAEWVTIDAWFNDLADRVVADQGWPGKRNNHVYWAGFAAGAVGTATGAVRHLDYSRRAFDAGLSDITPEGTLPMELARRQKALDYTNYALAPLILAAELAALRGEDWYDHHDGAIHRLVTRTLAGLRDPKAFAALAGESSVDVPRGGLLGWLAFYRLRFPDRVDGAPAGPFRYPWLGGDLTLTAKAWVRR